MTGSKGKVDEKKVERSRSFDLGYIRGLDGIRGVALIMVLLIHGKVAWMTGGFYAVDVFFVLSGFLITSLLLIEYQKRRDISLKKFWIRRSLRLFPALALAMLGITLYVLFFLDSGRRAGELYEIFTAVTYHNNWIMALTSNRGNFPVLVGHTWSLSIEMQFYLLWPLIVLGVIAVMRWRLKRRPEIRGVAIAVMGTALVLGLASIVTRTVLAHSGTDWWRIYGGTDTHVDGLLAGCVIACIAILGGLRRWPQWLGIAGLLGIVALVIPTFLMDPFAIQWGFTLVTLSATALIGSVAAGHPISRLFALTPFVFLGRISYSTYLWHWPVYLVVLPVGWEVSVPHLILAMAISISLGTASYYLVEIRALRLKRRFERTQAGEETVEAQISLTDRFSTNREQSVRPGSSGEQQTTLTEAPQYRS
ncbi:MAG: acyltransferase [Actinobacteria bacterium]|nr:acyltransferase [Actinomycetota bacterium]